MGILKSNEDLEQFGLLKVYLTTRIKRSPSPQLLNRIYTFTLDSLSFTIFQLNSRAYTLVFISNHRKTNTGADPQPLGQYQTSQKKEQTTLQTRLT